MKCETCIYFKLTHPPSIGECKRDSIARLHSDTCQYYKKDTNTPNTDFGDSSILDFFKGIFK